MYYSLAQEFSGALPGALLERYKTVDGAALKVALLFLERGSSTTEDIAAVLNLQPAAVERAVSFWESAGLITESGKAAPKRRAYTLERLARASLTNPEIPGLLREAQRLLGRPLSHAENLRLAALYEDEGLPPEFILFVLEYSRRLAEPGFEIKYAEKVALSWRKGGISTLSQAEEHLIKLERIERQAREVAEALGRNAESFTGKERSIIDDWYTKFEYDAHFAAEAAIQSGKTDIPYINAMLKSWHEKKYRTLRQTREGITNARSPGRKTAGGSLFDQVNKKHQGEPK